MRIFTAGFLHETANLSPIKEDEMYRFAGEEINPYFQGALQVFEEAGVELVKSVFFTTPMGAGGLLDRKEFLACADQILEDLKRAGDIDGVFLRLHGASDVEDLGQGEMYILRGIRDVLGYQVPVAVAMDPHGNLSPDIAKYANIIRAYHTAPHRDVVDTCRRVAEHLLVSIKEGKLPRPVVVRVPMLLSGDFAITDMEPTKSIMAEVEAWEKREEILCASFFMSFVFADVDHSYPCVVTVPSAPEHAALAEEAAHLMAEQIYAKRHEFRFAGLALSPEEAIKQALVLETPVIVSDSGDNPTGGGPGINTYFLRRFLEHGETKGRKILFSTIYDPLACAKLMALEEGAAVDFLLGLGLNSLSEPVRIQGVLKAKGRAIKGVMYNRDSTDYGNSVLVTSGDLTVQVTDIRDSLMYNVQLEQAKINLHEYDVIVIKQGYQFEDIAAYGKSHIMAYTPGTTYQDITGRPFSKVPKTIFPFKD
jgi:microcystin degradation protein MlrC